MVDLFNLNTIWRHNKKMFEPSSVFLLFCSFQLYQFQLNSNWCDSPFKVPFTLGSGEPQLLYLTLPLMAVLGSIILLHVGLIGPTMMMTSCTSAPQLQRKRMGL